MQFNALEYSPEQGVGKHPSGKFQVRIVDTETKPGKQHGDMMYVVTYASNAGRQQQRFNVVNSAYPDNQRIARQQLSAVCHAVEVFNLNIAANGRELLNKELWVDIAEGNDPKYSEVKTVYDIRGELPKARGQATQQAPAAPQPQFGPQAAQGQHFQGQPSQPAFAPQQQVSQAPQQFAYNGPAPQQQPAFNGNPGAQPMPPMGNAPQQQFAPNVSNPQPMPPQGFANGAPAFDPSQAPAQPAWAAPRQ